MISTLLDVPHTDREWARWNWHHAQDHLEIIQAIARQQDINLTQYILYPLTAPDLQTWLMRHQQAHVDMDAVLGVQSLDLQDVDLKDNRQLTAWVWQNYLEHSSAREALGI